MNSELVSENGVQCPAWCVMHGSPDHSTLWHVSEGDGMPLSRSAEPTEHESFEVRAAHYVSDDPADSWDPVVEVALRIGNRTRIVQLTTHEARRAAELLGHAADDLEGHGR